LLPNIVHAHPQFQGSCPKRQIWLTGFYPPHPALAYILKKPHDPVSADQMGNLWEFIAPEFQTISEISDWARLSSNGWLIVSEKTKILLGGKVAQ
jgi:hypothetical protein